MPQRFLRPGITNSERFNACSMHAQSLWLRILTRVDDYGRFDARPSVLAGELFSVWNEMHPEDAVHPLRIPALSCELQRNLLADFYEVDGKKIVQLLQWEERIREGAKEKWPSNPNPQRSAAFRCVPLLPSSPPSPTPSSPPAARRSDGGEKPEWKFCQTWLVEAKKNGADYTERETRSAFLALSANGWMWGKNPVVDYRSALERQIQTDREKSKTTPSEKPKKWVDANGITRRQSPEGNF